MQATSSPVPSSRARAFTTLDLFSGAGGLSLGFERAGFVPRLAVDADAASIATFNAHFGPVGRARDVEDLIASGDVPAADVVIGGPPCQGFSLLNKARRNDARRALWRPFMDAVEAAGARAFVIENVAGLLNSAEEADIRARAEDLGFSLVSGLLNAADYGAPQTRRRAFVVGVKVDGGAGAARTATGARVPALPTPTHDEKARFGRAPWTTVREALHGLPEPVGTAIRDASPPLDLHFGRSPTEKSLKRYRAVPPGGNRFDLERNAPEITPDCWLRKRSGGTDLFGRLWWDRPSVTIRTEFFKPEKGRYLHPEAHRPITHREAARLMGFPDDFAFKGTKIEIARQIGNAVPPPLAEAVARALRAVLADDAAARVSRAA